MRDEGGPDFWMQGPAVISTFIVAVAGVRTVCVSMDISTISR